jgi:hypothetical protein
MTADIDERAEQLESMTRRLVGLIAAEAEAVQAHRLSAANADWDEREGLKASAKELETALEAHAMALAASKSVTEGLVRSIAAEVAAVRSGPAGYGRTGGFNTTAPRQASGLALNAKA